MTLIDIIDTMRTWAEENVCSKLAFKKPPAIDSPDGRYYTHELVRPKAWAIYKPSLDVAKYLDYDCPCVVVQPIKLTVDPITGNRSAIMRLSFLVWNPGEHLEDTYDAPSGEEERTVFDAQVGEFKARSRYNSTSDRDAFSVDDDGWRDAFNFADCALNELLSTDTIGGLVLDQNVPIEGTPYSEESVSQYFYPYHFAKLEFCVKSIENQSHEDGRDEFL